jgi:hypothetical protein
MEIPHLAAGIPFIFVPVNFYYDGHGEKAVAGKSAQQITKI